MIKNLIPSASSILLRDGEQGLQTLLLKKNAKITFGGSWVFPGGRVDKEDHGEHGAYATERQTAWRECLEEANIQLNKDRLVPYSNWVTPATRPKRFKALFFIYNANEIKQEPEVDHGEIVDGRWFDLAEALQGHQTKELVLAGPAFVSLMKLNRFKTVSEAFANHLNCMDKSSAKNSYENVADFMPRVYLTEQGAICLYQADDAYNLLDDETISKDPQLSKQINTSEKKHRLYMFRSQPWQYVEDLTNNGFNS